MRCRCSETDAEVHRCLSSLRRAVDVVPDTRNCRRSSDGFVTPHKHPAERVQQVSVSTSQTTESTETATLPRPQSLPPQQDALNFDIRNYLIERCVTDTHQAAAAAAADNEDYCDGISDDKTDNEPSSEVLDLPEDSCERSTTPPPLTVIPLQRFSDTELVKRSHPLAVTGSATLPARVASVPCSTDSRAKRHRWKLLRKALNLFSFDESIADDDEVDRTVGGEVDDAGTADESTRTLRGDADDGGTVGDDGEAGQSDSGTAQSGEEQSQHLGAHSISVESLPGSVSSSSVTDVTKGDGGGRTAPGDTLHGGKGDTGMKLKKLWLNLENTGQKSWEGGN